MRLWQFLDGTGDLMRKLVFTLCIAASTLICAAASASADGRYYADYGITSAYGPFYDCNGQRCYTSAPYVWEKHHGRYYRVQGQFYHPPGAWFHPSFPFIFN